MRRLRGDGILGMGLLAAASIVWLVARTGRKPSRMVYPCQRAATVNVQSFLLVIAPSLGLRDFGLNMPSFLSSRSAKACLLLGSVLLASGYTASTTTYLPAETNYVPISLDLRPQTTLAGVSPSSLFFVQKASGTNGNMDGAISRLMSLMQTHGLQFFKTSSEPGGLIAKDDVVLIKVNAVGPERAQTNTDLVKSLIKAILAHPEGFTGEIVIADNGNRADSMTGEANAYDHTQSFQVVANKFQSQSHKVSAYAWYPIAGKSVAEYSQGNYEDGYVWGPTDPATGYRANYAKFRTAYGTYISVRNGIWSGSSYDYARLKLINMPVLKSHYLFGVTACVKNYHGVDSQTLLGGSAATGTVHSMMAQGALGFNMLQTRYPTLNILDAIYVNANPVESGDHYDPNHPGHCGPPTHYADASYTNTVLASTDPVALEYWAAKNILVQAAQTKGYTSVNSLNPDYAAIADSRLIVSYHNYLERSMNELNKAGYQATMSESEMNVFTDKVATPTFSPAAGTYSSSQNVELGCSTSGATVRYTTDGSSPSSSSAMYSSPIGVSSTTTIKAKAFKTGMTDSDTASATYTIEPVPELPFNDEFSGSLDGRWTWSNLPQSQSLTTKPGWLSVTPVLGTNFWAGVDTGQFMYQWTSGIFTIETKVSATLTKNYQQAGLMVRLDANNWTRTTFEYSNGLTVKTCVNQGGVASVARIVSLPAGTSLVYLGVTRDGNSFTAYYSLDGQTWTQHYSWTQSLSDTLMVGLCATDANSMVSFQASFDYFRYRSTAIPEYPSGLLQLFVLLTILALLLGRRGLQQYGRDHVLT